MPERHALISASAATRWMQCPASAYHSRLVPPSNSVYAEEGTKAHALSEEALNAVMSGKKHTKSLYATSDMSMVKHCMEYVDYCIGLYNELSLKHNGASLLVESEVSLDKYIPESFGTSDCIIISGNELHIIDLKYGMGVAVSAKDNTQLQLYGLGAYEKYNLIYDIDEVSMHIVQPRLHSISTQTKTITQLDEWAREYVMARAMKAWEQAQLDYNQPREYHPSDVACRFCPIKAECKKRAMNILESLKKYIGGDM